MGANMKFHGFLAGSSCATESEAGVRDSSLCDYSEESYGGKSSERYSLRKIVSFANDSTRSWGDKVTYPIV